MYKNYMCSKLKHFGNCVNMLPYHDAHFSAVMTFNESITTSFNMVALHLHLLRPDAAALWKSIMRFCCNSRLNFTLYFHCPKA